MTNPSSETQPKAAGSRFPEFNQVVISGRLTRDVNYKTTQTGRAMARFDIAVNRRWQNKTTQEWTEETTFVPVVAWADQAEYAKDNLKKGSPAKVEGRLRSYEYDDKEGNKRKGLEINAFKVELLDASSPKSGGRAAATTKPAAAEGEQDLEEVPF